MFSVYCQMLLSLNSTENNSIQCTAQIKDNIEIELNLPCHATKIASNRSVALILGTTDHHQACLSDNGDEEELHSDLFLTEIL